VNGKVNPNFIYQNLAASLGQILLRPFFSVILFFCKKKDTEKKI
jgi:uncharacterized protein YybS (DUF2232 family)